MCRSLFYLAPVIVALVVAGDASADLLGYWKLDENGGTIAADSSGNGNNGTIHGAPWTTGKVGSALDFDGVDDYVLCAERVGTGPGTYPKELMPDTFTVSCWTKLDNFAYFSSFVGNGMDTGDDECGFFLYNWGWEGENERDFGLAIRTETAMNYVETPNIYQTNTWYHLAATYDGAEVKIYVNGSLAAGPTNVGGPMRWISAASGNYPERFAIGVWLDPGYDLWIDGIVDEVGYWDSVLTELEIKKLAGRTKASEPSPADGAVYPDTWVNLSWVPGVYAVSHDVYLGDDFDDVNAGTGDTFRGNQATTFLVAGFFGTPYPDGLVPGTTYYWRIDEVNDADPNSPWKGPVWSFFIPPKKAYKPSPPDGAKYVDTGVALNWTAGLGARLHYVYFGDNFDTVNNATVGAPRGTTTYTPTGPLAKGKTYYWRVDEFDAAATHKGDVWSFTTLPDIAITNPDLIGWWKFDEGYGKRAIDFSGHGNDGTLGGDPQWVEGVMDGALDLSSDYVAIDGVVNDITGTNITLSAWIKTTQSSEGNVFAANDSASAHPLMFGVTGGNPFVNDGSDTQFPPAVNDGQWHMITYVRNGSTGYIYVDGVQVGTYAATFALSTVTRWSIGQEWDTATPSDFYTGAVDDVRIYNKALTADEVKQLTRGDLLRAWSPSPNNRSTVDVERARQPLTWSPGDKASQHDVYFGLDKDAVSNAGATDTTGIYRGRQSARSYSPPEGLAWGTGPYYWRIDEVNSDGTITTGSIWSFSVAGYLIVDDIESYNDIDPPNPGSNRVFDKWVDGFGTTTNGSLVGNNLPPYAQRSNVHGGGQAMPLSYDNNRKFSETTLTLAAGRDWTREGVANLSLWLRGASANAAERMYVALNGTAVVYNANPNATQGTVWAEWVIPLQQFAALGVNLANVTSITIGFGTRGNTTVAGGTGQMYIDDIRLYRS